MKIVEDSQLTVTKNNCNTSFYAVSNEIFGSVSPQHKRGVFLRRLRFGLPFLNPQLYWHKNKHDITITTAI